MVIAAVNDLDKPYFEDSGDYRFRIYRSPMGIVSVHKQALAGDATSASPWEPLYQPSKELPTKNLKDAYGDYLNP